MPIIRATTSVTKAFPISIVEVLEDPPETWTAKQLTGNKQRQIWETFNSGDYRTQDTFGALLAWLSFGGSTLQVIDQDDSGNNVGEKRKLFPRSEITFEEFLTGWDLMGIDMQDWIINDCVFEANPQWDNRITDDADPSKKKA